MKLTIPLAAATKNIDQNALWIRNFCATALFEKIPNEQLLGALCLIIEDWVSFSDATTAAVGGCSS